MIHLLNFIERLVLITVKTWLFSLIWEWHIQQHTEIQFNWQISMALLLILSIVTFRVSEVSIEDADWDFSEIFAGYCVSTYQYCMIMGAAYVLTWVKF